MVPSFTSLLAAFATCAAFTSAVDLQTPVGTLYAYGKGISGLPLFYGDGQC